MTTWGSLSHGWTILQHVQNKEQLSESIDQRTWLVYKYQYLRPRLTMITYIVIYCYWTMVYLVLVEPWHFLEIKARGSQWTTNPGDLPTVIMGPDILRYSQILSVRKPIWLILEKYIHIYIYIMKTTGWWFQTFYFPFHIWDVILPIDFHIFQDG